MRRKTNPQAELDFQPSNLKLTNAYFKKYEAVSKVLDENSKIVDLAHQDLKDALRSAIGRDVHGGQFRYTSDTILRILICQIIEGQSLRGIVIRIDDSHYLRRFVRLYGGPMLDYTTLCKLKNCLSPQTWKKINGALARYAVEQSFVAGDQLRIDTTAVETNIHWPTDSALLWDTYRTLARLIDQARAIDCATVGRRRLHTKKAKKLHTKIARKASKHSPAQERLKPFYQRLIEMTMGICTWSEQVRENLQQACRQGRLDVVPQAAAAALATEIAHYHHLGLRVIDQASRRVLDGEWVPNADKLFSIFEPHTELLKRGKTAKPIEFGHMIQIQQVEGKFITEYDVFDKKPTEHELLQPALDSHKKLFGQYPNSVAADKGYYESMAALETLEKKINVVSIAKKGSRTPEQAQRECDPDFRFAQRFRAGIEGTISFLKRMLGLFRCFNKGWEHYASTIGAAIFTHNVLILSRL